MAVNEAEILRNLTIGISRPDPVSDAVVVAITSWHKESIEIARKAILSSSLSKSGTLSQSIAATQIKKNGTLYTIEIKGDEAVDFIDKGVNGLKQSWGSKYAFKFPNPSASHIKAILGWIPSVGFTPRQKNETFEQIAYKVAATTKQKGIKPKRFLDIAFGKDVEDDLSKALSIALQQAVRIEFSGIAKKYNK